MFRAVVCKNYLAQITLTYFQGNYSNIKWPFFQRGFVAINVRDIRSARIVAW